MTGINGLSATFSIVGNSGYSENFRSLESESTSKKNEMVLRHFREVLTSVGRRDAYRVRGDGAICDKQADPS